MKIVITSFTRPAIFSGKGSRRETVSNKQSSDEIVTTLSVKCTLKTKLSGRSRGFEHRLGNYYRKELRF